MRLPRLFSAGMVVQQGFPVPVWGWSKPGQQVRVTLAGSSADTVAGPKGSWMVRLPALKAADHLDASLTLTVVGDETITISDVAVGEVWLCSGQSNMEWPLQQSDDAMREVGAAKFPRIRLFTVDHATAPAPLEDVASTARWQSCSPASAARFSAVGYFFGRELHQSLRVPIGLILSAWGGSLAEAWTSRAALASETHLRLILDRLADMPKLPSIDSPAYKRLLQTWESKAYHPDPGNQGARKGWAKSSFKDDAWPLMDLPRSWESTGLDIDGAVWFRHTAEIPATWKGKALSLSLGPIDDFDTTYVNGVEVGGIDSETPDAHLVPRVYVVPGKLVTSKRLVIAVRVFDRYGQGGLVGDPAQMTLALAPVKTAVKGAKKKASAKTADKPISLAGNWRYQIELRLEPRRNLPPPPLHDAHQDLPATLNNAMIQPLVPYALRGAIWYQGESNAERAEQYRTLLTALLRDWRMAWGQRDFHIGIVQLAIWRERRPTPGNSDWAELREAQALAARQDGNGLAVTIDIGDANDIHPRNKMEVGRRLALWARTAVYQQIIAHTGPRYVSTTIDGASIRLRFSHVDGGLSSRDGGPLIGFAIAGANREFIWAEARITGAEIVVTSPKVPKPMAVRYAWADNPACNLVNGAKLPAAPFRTDDWPLSTAGRR